MSYVSNYYAPPRRGGAGALSDDRRPSSVRLSVCLMSRTSAITRKPKGLGTRNFAQGYPRSHATPTPTSRSKGQKSRSRGGGILWRPPSRTACFYCRIRLEGLLYVAERDLLAIAKFLVYKLVTSIPCLLQDVSLT